MKSGLKDLVKAVKSLGNVTGRKSFSITVKIQDGDAIEFEAIETSSQYLNHISASPLDPLGMYSESFVQTFHAALKKSPAHNGSDVVSNEPAKAGNKVLTKLYKQLEKKGGKKK